MVSSIAVDFGTSNTVIAQWNEDKKTGKSIYIPEYSRFFKQNGEDISAIPSLIHYSVDGKTWIGNQVHTQQLYQSNKTFRWMKRYITSRTPLHINVNGNKITPQSAGKDFLRTILTFASQESDFSFEDEIGFSVPVDSYEHYEAWITGISTELGVIRYRLIDEPSAAALGYGANIQPNSVYLIFDFGGGTMHSSIVLMSESEQTRSGRRCRVLGKAGRDIGGTSIDHWIFSEFLKQNNLNDYDETVRVMSGMLLVACEEAKEKLSTDQTAEISIIDPDTGKVYYSKYTREDFERILDEHKLFTEMNRMIQASLNSAYDRGFTEQDISAVLLVGGSSQIPSVKKALQQRFGKDLVFSHRPLDAVAIGAAAFVSGVDFFDHIQHDYAIRFMDPSKGEYDYRVLVKKGTPYPSVEPLSKLTIKATYDGQEKLGIAIFEMGEQASHQTSQSMELVFDPGGSARIVPISPQTKEDRRLFWMNEKNQTFLTANPLAERGESRFRVEFNVDKLKRLTITARDIRTNDLIYKDFPVVKLK